MPEWLSMEDIGYFLFMSECEESQKQGNRADTEEQEDINDG